MINQIWNRLQLLFAQGTSTRVSKTHIQATVLDDDIPAKIKRIEPYGFSNFPHAGSQAYLTFPSGDRSYGIAIIVGDEKYQMTLQQGEVAIHDDEENWVHLKRGGTIEVKAATKVIAETPLFETSADAKIGGNLEVCGITASAQGFTGAGKNAALMQNGLNINGVFTVNGKDISDQHKHLCPTCGQSGIVV